MAGRATAQRGAQRQAEATWYKAAPAPVVLVTGQERLLAARAVERVTAALKRSGPVEVTRLDASAYAKGALVGATSPSLFAEPSLVVVEQLEAMNDDFLADALAYLERADPDCVVIMHHAGTSTRGKRLLDAMRSAKVPEYTCPAIKKDQELIDFATAELERAGRAATARTVRALVDAVGADVAELAAACAQLVADVDGTIDESAVARYYGTRVNATGFAVADAAIAGRTADALALVRHALETGTDPVPLVAVMAMKLRTLIKVGAMRGRNLSLKDVGMSQWQVDRVRRDLQRWDAERLAAAMQAVARADAEVKGASRAPGLALERAVRTVAQLAAR